MGPDYLDADLRSDGDLLEKGINSFQASGASNRPWPGS